MKTSTLTTRCDLCGKTETTHGTGEIYLLGGPPAPLSWCRVAVRQTKPYGTKDHPASLDADVCQECFKEKLQTFFEELKKILLPE